MTDFRYQPFYCEENSWWLCQRPELGVGARHVVFITNEAKQCLLHAQRAAAVGQTVVWDYHVIVVVAGRAWDLDSRLGLPVPLNSYLDATFPSLPPNMGHMAPKFRVITAETLTALFHSDRSHMRDAEGRWLRPPPPWKPPKAGERANQMRFVDLDDDIAGEILDTDELRVRYSK